MSAARREKEMSGPAARLLPDGRRLFLSHGPIDLVIEGFGEAGQVRRAYRRAEALFQDLLPTLAAELPLLRAPAGSLDRMPGGPVARRMVAAARPFAGTFVTPMAAVAGAVADHMTAEIWRSCGLDRLYVNDGGDIAFELKPDQALTCGLVSDLAVPSLDGHMALGHGLPVRGVATSSRSGRSFSLGIADAVTVLAADAATADLAATLIANAVDLPGHPAITRAPASDLDPDSDLGVRLVTVAVGDLEPAAITAALERGWQRALGYQRAGLIFAAVLTLEGCCRLLQPDGRKILAA